MPIIYYTYYTPVDLTISSIANQEHILGRELLLHGLKDIYGIELSFNELDSALKKDSNGKPFLAEHLNIFFNISHCDGLVACAFDTTSIGIDVEFPGYFPEILITKSLSKTEIDFLQKTGSTLPLKQEWFYRLWTLKEAYVKKSGLGVDTNLKDFSFSFTQTKDLMNIICSDQSVACYQTTLSQGHILSLCYENSDKTIKLIEYPLV